MIDRAKIKIMHKLKKLTTNATFLITFLFIDQLTQFKL